MCKVWPMFLAFLMGRFTCIVFLDIVWFQKVPKTKSKPAGFDRLVQSWQPKVVSQRRPTIPPSHSRTFERWWNAAMCQLLKRLSKLSGWPQWFIEMALQSAWSNCHHTPPWTQIDGWVGCGKEIILNGGVTQTWAKMACVTPPFLCHSQKALHFVSRQPKVVSQRRPTIPPSHSRTFERWWNAAMCQLLKRLSKLSGWPQWFIEMALQSAWSNCHHTPHLLCAIDQHFVHEASSGEPLENSYLPAKW